VYDSLSEQNNCQKGVIEVEYILFVRKLLRLPSIMQTLDKLGRFPFLVNKDYISDSDRQKAGVLPDWHAILDSVIT
jgi:hypothetical protein